MAVDLLHPQYYSDGHVCPEDGDLPEHAARFGRNFQIGNAFSLWDWRWPCSPCCHHHGIGASQLDSVSALP